MIATSKAFMETIEAKKQKQKHVPKKKRAKTNVTTC
jgi:hypothetical protein